MHERLATLRCYRIMDTPPEEAFDCITRLACRHFGVAASAVNLIDDRRMWRKSVQGAIVQEATLHEHAPCLMSCRQANHWSLPTL
jgi:hypothetical protein